MPAITKPSNHFDAILYTGNGATIPSSQSITGLQFQPDFTWIKSRSAAYPNFVFDAVRGAGRELETNSAATETNKDQLSAFNSNGFSVAVASDGSLGTNGNGSTFVAWNWNAGGSTVTNTTGSISSQVRANPTAGFSVVTWTGNGVTAATVGHGLQAIPAMIICKERSGTDYWHVKHKSTGTNTNLFLNTTSASTSAASVGDGILGDLSSNTTFGFATAGSPNNVVAVNENGITNVAYCWSEIPGYSAFGSYTGNGSTDGPFIYTGFRPRMLIIKRSGDGVNDWAILDTAREPNNVGIAGLKPNSSSAQYSGYNYRDMLSNGFKLRNGDSDVNNSGSTYIYAAFAEAPFKFASAR